MDRKLFLELCQKCAMIPNRVLDIKENIPDEFQVVVDGVCYYPMAYKLSFDENGGPRHTVLVHDLHWNSVVEELLERVEPKIKGEQAT